jgi:hypothetical protein
MTRHPLVIVLVIAVIGIGFYYYASPYENCKREANNKKVEIKIGSLMSVYPRELAMRVCRKEPW